MCGATSTGDYYLNSALFGGPRVLEQKIGGAMRRDDLRLVGNAKSIEDLRGVLHGVPIRLGAHDQSNERIRHRYPRSDVLLLMLELPTQSVFQLLEIEIDFGDHLGPEIILVGNANVGEREPFVLFDLGLVFELEQQIADAAKTLAMVWSDAVGGQAANVIARGVTGVVLPNILRITASEPRHEQVARDLGEYGCAGDAEAPRVAVNHCGVRYWQRPHRSTVDHNVIRCHFQASERTSHGEHTRLIHVDAVDLSHGSGAEGERYGPLTNLGSEAHSLFVRQPLRVIDTNDGAGFRGHDHRARDDWACYRAAAHFVNAREQRTLLTS